MGPYSWLMLVHFLSHYQLMIEAFSSQEKIIYKNKVQEMFSHAFNAYMDHAYPADELMPLTCKGRVRGRDRSRGDIDDALGMFSLTLVDSLDTLAVLGRVDEFNSAIRTIIRDVTFDRDLVVSVFETNIRVLGGLLGAHFAAVALKESHRQLSWYNDHLLRKAIEVGRRLLPAFNTTTGLPYPKINLRHGMNFHNAETTTCTACAGTLLMEFAALSRLTGDSEYERKAHHAMDVLWRSRHHGHNLLGTVINVHNGEWTRRDSGVGAGSDSYYEYVLKSYILLGDEEYLKRFHMHYGAIKKYISNGPMLVDVSMNAPTRMTRSFMDSLLAFWPGLQVLWGDVDAAIQTHDMLYHVTEKHNFLPEAFTMDFRVHWGNHPLRPEFSESTYFLYKATKDPYYLDVGKTIVDNLNEYARVSCGFAAIKDLRNNEHEDRMDSFVLAETFKYLFLLFAENEDVPLNLDDFVFTTEAHLFPLSLSSANTTRQATRDAKLVVHRTPIQTPPPESSEGSTSSSSEDLLQPRTRVAMALDRQKEVPDQPAASTNSQSIATDETSSAHSQPPRPSNQLPPPPPAEPVRSRSLPPRPLPNYMRQPRLRQRHPRAQQRPPPQSHSQAPRSPQTPQPPPSTSTPSSTPQTESPGIEDIAMVEQLQCPNNRRPFVLHDQFLKLVLKQCTSSRFRMRPNPKKTKPPRLDVRMLDFSNPEQVHILTELGIIVESVGDGKVQVSHSMQKAKTPEDAEEGWYLMQDIMKLMNEQKKMQEEAVKGKRSACQVKIVDSVHEFNAVFEAGPALFGPALGIDIASVTGELHVLSGSSGSRIGTGCNVFADEDAKRSGDKIVMMERGGCLFIQKVRNAQKAGATGVIIADNVNEDGNVKTGIPFSMSGDGVEDVEIPSVFIKKSDALLLQRLLLDHGEVVVEMAANILKKEENFDEKIKAEGKDKIELSKEHKDLEESGDHSKEVQELSQKVQSLLEGFDTEKLPEELKDTFKNELGKLKELNLEGQTASSPESTCSADVSRSGLKKTVVDLLDSLQDFHSTTPHRIVPVEDSDGNTVLELMKNKAEDVQVSSNSEGEEVREQSLVQDMGESSSKVEEKEAHHHASTCSSDSPHSQSQPGPG